MSNIFQINQDYLQLAQILEDDGGEVTPEIEEQLAINREQLQTKGVNYAFVVKKISSEVDTIDAEIKRLQEMKKAKVNAIERMKKTIKDAMILHGIDKIQGDLINLSLRKSPASVVVENEDQIPDDYKIEQPKKLDKKAVVDALKKGFEVKGAYLNDGGKSLIIK